MKTKKILSVLQEVKDGIEVSDICFSDKVSTKKAVKAVGAAIEAVEENKKLEKKVAKLKSKIEKLERELEEKETSGYNCEVAEPEPVEDDYEDDNLENDYENNYE